MFRDKFSLICPSCQCLGGFAPLSSGHTHTHIWNHTRSEVYSLLPCQMCRSRSPSHSPRASHFFSPQSVLNSPLAAAILAVLLHSAPCEHLRERHVLLPLCYSWAMSWSCTSTTPWPPTTANRGGSPSRQRWTGYSRTYGRRDSPAPCSS